MMKLLGLLLIFYIIMIGIRLRLFLKVVSGCWFFLSIMILLGSFLGL